VFKHRTIILRIVGLFGSCVLIFIGILMLRRSSIVPGIIVTLVATLLFVLTAFFNEKYPLGEEDAQAFKPYLIPVLFWILSAAALIYAINVLAGQENRGPAEYWVSVAWLGSLLFLIVGMLLIAHWQFPKWQQIKEWFVQNKQELLIVTAILLVGGFFRVYLINLHPFPWSGDESSIGTEGSRILKGEVTNFFEGGWSGQPNWSFVPTALAETIFGQTILAVRVVSILEGTLTILFTYLLARELFEKNRMIAILAAGFMVAFPVHLQFSRLGVNDIMDGLNVTLVLWLLVRAIRKDRLIDYLWAGIAGGLTFYTYIGSRLVLVLAVFVLAYTVIRQRSYLRSHFSHLGIFLAGVVVAIAPEGLYFLQHYNVFLTRWAQANIFSNHWLIDAAHNANVSIPAFLWKHFTDTILVYISNPAVSGCFNSPLPYLTIIGSILFLFGMGYAFSKLFEAKMMTLLVWFWAVIFLGGFMTQDAPANSRLVMSLPAVAVFVGLGIYKFTDYLLKIKLLNLQWQKIVTTLIVLILVVQNIGFYFGVYYYKNYNEDANGELGQQTGLELQRLGPDYDLYMFGIPRVFAAFPTTVFLAPDNNLADLTTDKIDNLVLRSGKGNIFVAIPENRADLTTIEQKFPGGRWESVQRRFKAEVLYFAYLLPPK
jgi:4-amino-4-deoxy-L-arabinose transferase-like glycosyltransferase